jgi:hypothetical protein
MKPRSKIVREQRTARLTVLIDPRKKAVFEELCAAEDVTPSQVVRSLIRRYIEERLGAPWAPADATPADTQPTAETEDGRREKRAAARRRL